MKQCFKCGQQKNLSDFYKHKKMADGHLNKCKDCTKSDVQKHYADNREDLAAYDKARGQRPERKAQKIAAQMRHRKRHPSHERARRILNYNVRTGNLTRKPCEVCGDTKSQAHHHDYNKPLDVQWLCFKHHREDEHDQVVVQG